MKRLLAIQPETVIVADDHPLFRSAIREALQAGRQVDRVLEASCFEDLQELVAQHPDVDLVLLDLHMPGVSGFAGLVFLGEHYPSVPVVIISANEDPVVMRRALQHGAAGFIPKSSGIEIISEAIDAVLMGEIWAPDGVRSGGQGCARSESELAERLASLTPQQFKVLMMMSQGLLNKQIAHELGVSEATIKAHVTAIMSKLKVSNRTQAVLAAQQLAVTGPNPAV